MDIYHSIVFSLYAVHPIRSHCEVLLLVQYMHRNHLDFVESMNIQKIFFIKYKNSKVSV